MNSCIKDKFSFGNLATKNSNTKFILIYRLAAIEAVGLILPLHFRSPGIAVAECIGGSTALGLFLAWVAHSSGDGQVDCIYL